MRMYVVHLKQEFSQGGVYSGLESRQSNKLKINSQLPALKKKVHIWPFLQPLSNVAVPCCLL